VSRKKKKKKGGGGGGFKPTKRERNVGAKKKNFRYEPVHSPTPCAGKKKGGPVVERRKEKRKGPVDSLSCSNGGKRKRGEGGKELKKKKGVTALHRR